MRRLWFGPPKNFGLRTAYAYAPPPPVLGVAPPPHSNKILVTSLVLYGFMFINSVKYYKY